ncbi:Protein kinase-like domain [Pseudocohnilembus persalinus]|uniref:Protein kinase-like domain n=1 Tax=Pseudocohnilembus persalinus TaxID=266149 RepID=A0A0V0QNG9_PSEPJ|nr:Protein kinase-like domain [Pseudocohnilembus persalinus]|eukprot:KRX03493.1 Protein kinase-like domain [Pseudocohnilembus persalinus]
MNQIPQLKPKISSSSEKGEEEFQKEYDMSKARYLGGGAFGKVYAIESQLDKQEWAIFTWHKHPFYYVVIVMEKGEQNLQSEINQRKLKNNEFTDNELDKIFKQCLDGLNFMAKSKEIYHRDIKPENILINPKTLEIKLTDFGLSKVYHDEKIKQSMAGNHTILGSPVYLSPLLWNAYIKQNQFKVSHNLEKSDVFSLGLTFLQISLLLSHKDLNGLNQEDGTLAKAPNLKM